VTAVRALLLLLTAVLFSAGCSIWPTDERSSIPAKKPFQGQDQNEAPGKMLLAQEKLPTPPERPPSDPMSLNEYRIGKDDELDISVYGDDDLTKTQTVRPDGKIAFPLIGDIQASGITPDELREQMTQRLSRYLKNPQVTVIVSKYNSKQVFVLGQVRTPGVFRLSSDINVLQGVARAGGVTEEADLQGALLIRDARVVPVNFERLLKSGDFTQNILLRPNDAILIPNVSAKKAFILGEVKQPLVVTLKHNMTLIESISMAGGFTRDAKSENVLIVRGGLGNPQVITVNVDRITDSGTTGHSNVLLQPNDIVYVPQTLMAKIDRVAEHVSKILSPIILTEFGISLYPSVKSVITTGTTPQPTLIPQPQP
jgi:polysaccharide export outer membrane protein